MKFSLQTLSALIVSVAILLTFVRSTGLGIAIMVFVLPISMMVIAITLPQKGNQLDPSKSWWLFILAKTWAFTLTGLVLIALLCSVSPNLQDRLFRGMNGDMRRHQIFIAFPGDWRLCDSLRGKHLTLHDSSGLVGEVCDVDFSDRMFINSKEVDARIWLLVSTDREDALHRNRQECVIEIRKDGSLHIVD